MKRNAIAKLPLAAAIVLAISTSAYAQKAAAEAGKDETAPTLEVITVTAQKRVENLQVVPISIQVLGTQQLDELNINDFDDIVKLIPSVSFESNGPGFNQVYMRGVASGGNGNHSASLPSVGVYLDEQPITTIQGTLDLHMYDIARVEALAGPQGTLYGASSQSGTLRMITNKPDPGGFESGYGLEYNSIDKGGNGHVAEAFVNIPLSETAAIRLVGWTKEDAGYIDNVLGTRTFPSWRDDEGRSPGSPGPSAVIVNQGTISNADMARKDYNFAETTGVRAALKFDIGENWSITPTVMTQRQKSNGNWGYDPVVGDLEITHFYPEKADDEWTQAALTVQGKIGNFDITYAFADLKRDVDSESDYNDYAFWYDTLLGYGTYFYDDDGALINPSQYIQARDGFSKRSHELRISSPSDQRFRFVAGVFWQQQRHNIEQRYRIDGLASSISVTGWEDTIWLTQQVRRDHDAALFGEMSFDFTDKLTATAGMRFFRAENSLKGFFGFSDGYSGSTGEAACFDQADFRGAPCVNLDKVTRESDSLGRLNISYQIDDNKMIYGTWSEGYRPGGINRRGTLPPYASDFLTNWEFGWKTKWADNRLVFNGAVFQEGWQDFQFAILGQNGLTEIKNANQARIRGVEMDLIWAATYNLRLSGGLAIYDAKLTKNYCGFTDANGNPVSDCPTPEAPAGTRLPVTADFKGNLTARYNFDIGQNEFYWQASLVHEGDRTSDLRLVERDILGDLDAYSTLDLSFGFKRNNWAMDFYLKNAFDERAELSKFVQCPETICGNLPHAPVPGYEDGQVYTVTNQPRSFGIRFSQKF